MFYDGYGLPVWDYNLGSGQEHLGSAMRAQRQPFQYKGQAGYYADAHTGLYYCHHRYYNPVLARWMSVDPIGLEGGFNVYEYCSGDPINVFDADGLRPLTVADLRRLWKLQDEARLQKVNQSAINRAVRDIKAQIAAVPTDNNIRDPQQLRVVFEAIDQLGNVEWESSRGRYFCNMFTAHCLEVGGWSVPKRTSRKPWATPSPVSASMWYWVPDNWSQVYAGKQHPGDVIAWLDDGKADSGHVGIYVGGGLSIYAGPDDIKLQSISFVCREGKQRFRYIRSNFYIDWLK